jgi:hypothetical protein
VRIRIRNPAAREWKFKQRLDKHSLRSVCVCFSLVP